MSNSVSLIPGESHFISLTQAVAMTSLYRKQKDAILKPEFQGKNIMPICETFNRSAFDYLLSEGPNDCVGLRFYLGMDDTLNIKLIAVGVNSKGEDMLPLRGDGDEPESEGNEIVENGQRCPFDCPPESPLNQ